VLIVDTAGRLQIDEALMDELRRVKEAVQPDEILLVADAMTGQEAVTIAKGFDDALGITGVVMTKMDGDARGGAALSIRGVTGKPIKFIGVGEGVDDLDVADPERLAGRILQMGDVVGLVERAQAAVDDEEREKLEKKMLGKGRFTLEDFLVAMRQVQKMGPLDQLLKLIPGAGKMKIPAANMDPKRMKHVEAIILSMTLEERRKPEILNGSRRARIAKGSGRPVAEVNRLMKQFKEMEKFMKQMKGMMGRRQDARHGWRLSGGDALRAIGPAPSRGACLQFLERWINRYPSPGSTPPVPRRPGFHRPRFPDR
jgi:signal recognition particle subunit SRP54